MCYNQKRAFIITLKYVYNGAIMEDSNVDYKELYLKLFRATEAAIRLLVEAQRECEEAYLSADDRSEKEK